jgi:hypothetical protein
VISATLENAIQGGLQRYENNYKALNLITTALCRNVYDHIVHIETAHDILLKLCPWMIALLKLNHLARIHGIGSTKPLLRNLESLWMIALLGLSPL